MSDETTIPETAPEKESLNFHALRSIGVARSQTLSSAHWTDFNEHDPGVTILEYLAYAVTDIAYRTAHPIEDILASSSAATGVDLDKQPLYTGDRALTVSPLTHHDYRKMLFDGIKGVRNVWLQKVEGDVSGLMDVYVQGFTPIPELRATMTRGEEQWPRILADVERLLHTHRNIGEDVRFVRKIGEAGFAINAVIEVEPDAHPEGTVAMLCLNVESCINRMPILVDVDGELQKNARPDQVFDGPPLAHGVVVDGSLQPLTQELPVAAILEAMRSTEGVLRVSQMQFEDLGGASVEEVSAPVLSRAQEDMAKIRVVCDGVSVEIDTSRVQYHLLHYEEKQRWQAISGMRRMLDAAYRQVPMGDDRRHLSRYRSIQHLFPSIYGLGNYGSDDQSSSRESSSARDRNRAVKERRAEVRQLKAYLSFFEQLLANSLAQLENTARLFSFEAQDRTYYSQPLMRPDAADDDDMPGIAPVLGAPDDAAGSSNGGLDEENWYNEYVDGLEQICAQCDDPNERQNRALDHLLARFNERFDDRRLEQLKYSLSDNREEFLEWLAERKRAFLKDYVPLSARRATGMNLLEKKPTYLQERIRLKSGFDGHQFILEHVLLRGHFEPGLADGTAALDAMPAAGEVDAIALSLPAGCGGTDAVHLIVEAAPAYLTWVQLARGIVELGRDVRNYSLFPPGAYQVAVRLHNTTNITVQLLENFTSESAARRFIDRLAEYLASFDDEALVRQMRPATLPVNFFSSSASVVLASCRESERDASPESRAFVESVVTDNFPAHVEHFCYWLDAHELASFERDYDSWLDAMRTMRMTSNPGVRCQLSAEYACASLRRWISRLHTRTLLASRSRRWEATRRCRTQ